jgi:N-acetylglutamate synthase/N-acetylornithine aminotransferase
MRYILLTDAQLSSICIVRPLNIRKLSSNSCIRSLASNQFSASHLHLFLMLRWAAVFTKNMFPGAPVIVGRERLASGTPLQAIVINNKISNVCPGGEPGAGVRDSKLVCDKVADIWSLQGDDDDGGSAVLPCSTGVIGWRLPVQVSSWHKRIATSFACCNLMMLHSTP